MLVWYIVLSLAVYICFSLTKYTQESFSFTIIIL